MIPRLFVYARSDGIATFQSGVAVCNEHIIIIDYKELTRAQCACQISAEMQVWPSNRFAIFHYDWTEELGTLQRLGSGHHCHSLRAEVKCREAGY